jgi:peptide/nickel transport system substrate-binding protein
MNSLLQQDPYDANAPMIPDLAYGWTVHEDAQGVTFFFREGIKWHNGAAFTCEDARFSFETMKTGEGLTASYMKAALTHIAEDSPMCLDDLSLEFRFKTPTAIPLLTISNPYALIFNKGWFEAGGEEAMFQDVSVGTGPFVWAPGQEVGTNVQRYEKNPDYFIEELPYLDEVVIVGIVDESAQQAAMLAHQTDWHWVRNFGQYDAYVDHDQIMTVIRPIRSGLSYFMNKRNPPFDNVRVRQAVAMGIDREAAIQILQQGHGSLGFLFPPGSTWELSQEQGCAVPGWCQPDDMESQRAKARQILEEEGFDFTKTYIMTVESEGQAVARSTFIQEQLRLLGINTDFDQVESVAYYQQTVDGTWGDFIVTTANLEYDDPAGLGISFRCNAVRNLWNPGTECDQKMEELLDRVDSTLDPVERKRISDEIQLYAMEQYWKLDVYWETEAAAFWPEVRGYYHYPKSNWHFWRWSHVWIDPAHKDDKGFRGQTTGVPGGIQQ